MTESWAPRPGGPGVLMVTGAYFPELSGGGLQCKAIIDAWLVEPESKIDRHQRRVDKMDEVGGGR